MSKSRSSSFDVEVDCGLCGGRHRVGGHAELVRQPMLFGGAGVGTQAESSTISWTGPIICPDRGELVEVKLLLPVSDGDSLVNVNIISVEVAGDAAAPSGRSSPHAVGTSTPARREATPGDWIDEELREWRKVSLLTARTYATTMLTTSSGGVLLYFAVLNYLGWADADFSTPWVVASAVPPTLLFAAAGLFTLALRPSLSYVDRSEYAEFRARRIMRMQRRATAGTVSFCAALLISIVVFVALLAMRLP